MQTDSPTSTLLGGRSPATFLENYWQKQPLVVRDAIPSFRSPLSPNELAGLACENGVESRLVLKQGGTYPWELRTGPFDQDEFLTLPETHWTVLVQEVDRLIPEVGALLDYFRFLPDWRIDDIMVSYAPTHGTVGPHVDNYDVFLLQGSGHRRWGIGTEPVDSEEIVPDLDVRILADFDSDEEFVLGPGDMLYLPPRVGHHGVAEDDECMTYSVGFRAPSHQDLVGAFLQHALEHVDPGARYNDPDLEPVDHAGEIHKSARTKVHRLLQGLVEDDASIDHWFGEYVTRPDRDRQPVPPETPASAPVVADALQDGFELRRGPVSNLAFIEHDDTATLFVNGTSHTLDPDLAYAPPLLTGREVYPADRFTPHLDDEAFVELLTSLVNDGVLEFDDQFERK